MLKPMIPPLTMNPTHEEAERRALWSAGVLAGSISRPAKWQRMSKANGLPVDIRACAAQDTWHCRRGRQRSIRRAVPLSVRLAVQKS